MEPLVPEEGVRPLEDDVAPLIAEANRLPAVSTPSCASRHDRGERLLRHAAGLEKGT